VACEGDDEEDTTNTGTSPPAATTPAATHTPASTPAATPTPGGGDSTASITIEVADHPQLGEILTDGDGRTLYLFTRDAEDQSNCSGQCAQTWPPLTTTGEPDAGTGADDSLLGTTTRDDGATQVTYNGHPLYYYAPDTAPGQATGQNVGGVWFVVSPDGEQVTS
jgi:predicted lipoprotein with Yx(FWY)xxD motif